jgi:hypothetical protein
VLVGMLSKMLPVMCSIEVELIKHVDRSSNDSARGKASNSLLDLRFGSEEDASMVIEAYYFFTDSS